MRKIKLQSTPLRFQYIIVFSHSPSTSLSQKPLATIPILRVSAAADYSASSESLDMPLPPLPFLPASASLSEINAKVGLGMYMTVHEKQKQVKHRYSSTGRGINRFHAQAQWFAEIRRDWKEGGRSSGAKSSWV